MIEVLLLVAAIIFLYYVLIKPQNYWKNRHVETGKLTPLVGDSLSLFLGKESVVDMVYNMYNKVPNVRYSGHMQFQTPVLLLKSPDLIKQTCVKDFDHFLDHRNVIPDGVEDLWSKNLVALKGHTWKHMRSTLSPSFTSSKMKSMFMLICHKADLFVNYFLKKDEKLIDVEFKDAFTRYTNDVIASTAFGIEVDSLGDRENEFYMMGKEASNFTGTRAKIVFSLYTFLPKIAGFFRIPIFKPKVKSFFVNIVKDTIKMREEQNIKRPDMLGLLLEAKNGHQLDNAAEETTENSFAVVKEHLELKNGDTNLTDMDITSQVFIFFLGGFETVATAMCYVAYELAVNPDVQQRLIEEVDENRPKRGAPSYDVILSMTYLDMVISETLRKWPVAVATDRVVTKPYTIQPELPNEKPLNLEVGTTISIPTYGLHHDPKYYANPEKFDPERFSPENRKNINPYTYLPFGVGPRNCIGSRFALLEIKAVLFHLLCHFEIVPTEKTEIPLKLSKTTFSMTPDNGFPLGLKRRI